MTNGILAPTVEDVELVMSWLPQIGAEEFRSRLLEVRSRLIIETHQVVPSDKFTRWLEWTMDYKDPAEHSGKEG